MATVRRPSSLAARRMRMAISPRFRANSLFICGDDSRIPVLRCVAQHQHLETLLRSVHNRSGFMRPLLVTSLALLAAFAASSQTTTPVITPSGILNAASYLGEIAPGSLATLFGNNLADNTYQGSQVLDSNNHFATSVAGVSVSVNGMNAPLIYVSPTQINFQVPWETALSTAVAVQVTRATVQSNVETITIPSTASPSMFLNDYTTGVAWVTGTVSEG